MNKENVIFKAFDDIDFKTSYEIYKNNNYDQVEKTQLKNFIKSVGDL